MLCDMAKIKWICCIGNKVGVWSKDMMKLVLKMSVFKLSLLGYDRL